MSRVAWDVPRVTVDAVVLHREKLVLVRRGKEPFKGSLALPGGFVEFGERLEDAVEREVKEETGLECEVQRMIGVYGDPDRDPRGHTISVAYELRSVGGLLQAGTDAAEATLVDLDEVTNLAFDHLRIVEDYRRCLVGRPGARQD